MALAHGIRTAAAERDAPRMVSVVMPLLNKVHELPTQLEALAAQSYEHKWELVIADNGSTDGSLELARSWLPRLPQARLIEATAVRNASHARNAGAAEARGELLLFTDADDRVRPDWVAHMSAAATRADLVAGGVMTGEPLNPARVCAWHDICPRERALAGFRFLNYASGTSTGIWADVFDAIGGFDELRPVGEDIELSWRAQVEGYRLVFAPEAIVELRLRGSLPELVRQHFSYGKAAPQLYRRFREHGMPPADAIASARGWARVWLGWPGAIASPRLRGRWALEAAMKAGHVVSCARERVLFL